MTTTIDRRGLIAVVDGVVCTVCGTHAFPPQLACPRCGAPTELVALPDRGQLWSWTIQHIQPKPPYRGPEPFEPFALPRPVPLFRVVFIRRVAGRRPGEDTEARGRTRR